MNSSGSFADGSLPEIIGELLEGRPLLRRPVDPCPIEIARLRLIDPELPEHAREDVLGQAGRSVAGLFDKILDKILGGDTDWQPNMTHSSPFTLSTREIRGTPRDANPWAWLIVREAIYDGEITVDGQVFSFDSSKILYVAESYLLNSDGRDIRSGVEFTYVPHREHLSGKPIGRPEELSNIPYMSVDASHLDNLRAIVEAAFLID